MRVGKALAALGILWAASGCSAETSAPSGPTPQRPTSTSASPAQRATSFDKGWSEIAAPPDERSGPASGWTGERLLIWGGYIFDGMSGETPLADGYSFDPHGGDVSEMSASPLEARALPAHAWTGEELLIWGGWDRMSFREESFFDDGAAYDPATDTWRELAAAPLSARAPFSVWTGEEMLVWGTQLRTKVKPQDGAAYDPSTDSWRLLAEAPIYLTDATAVWSGEEMIVFGASLHGGNRPDTPTAIAASYDPSTDTWTELPESELSPQASTAAMAGDVLVGWDYNSQSQVLDPSTGKWGDTMRVPLDDSECSPVSISLGQSAFGNYCGSTVAFEDGRWHDESPPQLEDEPKDIYYYVNIEAAGDTALVFARPASGKGGSMGFSYRP